jgi:NADPH-dependent ferric siderophore reductase
VSHWSHATRGRALVGVDRARTIGAWFCRTHGVSALALMAAAPAIAAALNDYPTTARADYVFACMKSNGETRQALEQCSCSIDIIASLLPYDRYVTAETVLSMAQAQGRLGAEFRSTEEAKAAVDDLQRAQAEAEVRCF